MEQLGKGAAGTVFRARDSLLGIDVCVKVLHQGLATQPGIIERFKRELLLARRIAHPGICKIFDLQEANGTNFLTMEYVKGETLSALLNRDGQMAAKDAVRLMRKVSEALGAAHKAGVVHRDIKPGNIIIGDNDRVTIVDFGVATAEDLDRLTRAGVVLGSRSYMAPETWQGKAATASGDVWALGVILYGCLTGRLPYKGEGVVGVFDAIKNTKPMPPSAVNDQVTPELEHIIFKAMCVDPADRYQDAGAVESALASFELALGDDGAATVVRAPSFTSGSSSGAATSRGASSMRSGPSQPPQPAVATTKPAASTKPGGTGSLPEPPRPSERLHRPGPTSLPRPPSSSSSPPVAVAKPAGPIPSKSTEEISLIGDEMSLYAPADVSGIGAKRSEVSAEEPGEATRITAPPTSKSDVISAENVAAAFDAAFGLSEPEGDPVSDALDGMFESPPQTSPNNPGSDASQPPTVASKPAQPLQTELEPEEMQGMNLMLGQKVLSGEGVEQPPGPGRRGLGAPAFTPAPSVDGWEVHPSSEGVLDLDGATRVQDNPGAQHRDEGDALAALAASELSPMDKTAVSEEPLSPFQVQSDDAFFAAASASDATRIEPFPMAPDATVTAASDDPTHHIERGAYDDDPLLPARAGPTKGLLLAAAAGLIVVVVGAAFALGGDDAPSGGDDQLAVAPGAGTDPASAGSDPAGAAESGWVFPEEEGKAAAARDAEGEKAPAAGDEETAPASAAADKGAASEDETAPEPAATAGEAQAADETAEEGAPTSDEATDEVAAADEAEPAADEEEEPAAVEAAEEEPAVVATKRRKQRPSGQAAAKSKYNRKRSALNSALAKKGILPGDVASVDAKRRAMTAAARRGDYSRAADAADDAISELGKVKIDAGLVGKKLARFNQGYDKTKDEALRTKLKGVLKQVGADYSKGRYDEANKKLNRAFSLMGR